VLELLAQADPLAAIMAGLWLFAAGMFPIGIMLGSSCSPCCGPGPCNQCTEGELPNTLTVAFSGLADKAAGPDLISLSFSACYGSGASAKVTAPGGDPDTDKGPIGAVELTDGGSGYAKLGRVAPTLTISGGSGTGATFTPTLTKSDDACGVPSWSLSSVSVSGGTGYVDGESLTITVASGDTEEEAATAIVATSRSQPTLTASAPGGSGATFSISYTANGTTPETWGVSSVSVTDGGSGYSDGDPVTFSLGTDDVAETEAVAYIYTVRDEPTLTIGVESTGGSGAVLTPTLSAISGGDINGRPIWGVASIAIDDGGSGYAVGDQLTATPTDGEGGGIWYEVSSVDGSGAITAVTGYNGGEFFKDTGEIDIVQINYLGEGSYYKTGALSGVTVTNGGVYYREDASASPYVADVTVTISQVAPSDGTGAEISATVGSTPGSATFGKITGLTIDDGGDGYLAHELFDTCLTRFDGRSIVVQRSALSPCVYEFRCALSPPCSAEDEIVIVNYNGPSQPMTLSLYAEVNGFEVSEGATGTMQATENVANCSSISVTMEPVAGVPVEASATIEAGGTYEATETCKRFADEDLESVVVDVTWGGQTFSNQYPAGPAPCSAVGQGNQAIFGWTNCGSVVLLGWNGGATCQPWEQVSTYNNGAMQLGVRGCELFWKPHKVFGEYAKQNATRPHFLIANCRWVYLMTDVPTDADGFPDGAATVIALPDDPMNTTFGTCPDHSAVPSITFSRLP
jgi:hypothetical protein